MKKYLYAVQDENGREILAAEVETEKVSRVTAERQDGEVVLLLDGEKITSAPVPDEKVVRLHRWPSDDKLSEPVSKPIS